MNTNRWATATFNATSSCSSSTYDNATFWVNSPVSSTATAGVTASPLSCVSQIKVRVYDTGGFSKYNSGWVSGSSHSWSVSSWANGSYMIYVDANINDGSSIRQKSSSLMWLVVQR
jgi:hypothetical protein